MPVEVALAVVLVLIKHTASTGLLIYDRDRLQSVGKDDVGVHSGNIHVID